MVRRMVAPLAVAVGFAAVVAGQSAPEKIDTAMNAKIRAEGLERSQLMRLVHMMTDVHGPRLTGSPQYQAAAEWAVKEMTALGMTNAHLEPFNWGREGWSNEKASGHIVSPVKDNLVFEVLAWTKSTNGTVVAPAVNLVTPEGPPAPGAPAGGPRLGPTEEELTKYFNEVAPRVRGAIVLVGASRVPPLVENEPRKRRDDEQTRRQYNPEPGAADAGRGGGRGGGNAPQGGRGAQAAQAGPVRLTAQQVTQRVREFLKTNGAAVRVNDAGRRHGQIVAFAETAYKYVTAESIPTVVLRNEDYGRIARMLAANIPVTLEFTIENRTYPNATTQYNVIGEIRGTDKADEVIMLGGHFDSWHNATGATDNAIGCAIMMEAARILKAVGAQPRRTIRVALWGGEEQGLIGSQAYVREHFGTFEDEKRKPEYDKFGGYWNIDTGTGALRGVSVFGPPDGARILAQLLKPWEEFKVYGALPSTGRNIGGTDHTSFNNAGLPGIGTSLDPIEYDSHTHHVNLDTYERIVVDDVKRNAVVTASVMYHLATRDELLPRFPAAQMPPRPGAQQR